MSNKNLFVFAGWSAILSVAFSMGMYAFDEGVRGGLFLAVSLVAYFFAAVVFYALYVFHRPQSALLSLIMMVCGIVGMVMEGIGSGPGTPLAVVSNALYAASFLLIGYLGFGNSQMPRWVAICAYAVGVSSLASAILTAVGQASLAETLGLVFLVAWIVWSVGILIKFSFSKTALATA